MPTVTQDIEGRRVRVERIDCSTSGGCGPCSREPVGQEGVLTNVRIDGRGGAYGSVDGRNFIREVTLLDTDPAAVQYSSGQRVRVVGDQGNHGWTVGSYVTLVQRAEHMDSIHNETMWLATRLPYVPGQTTPRHSPDQGGDSRYIAEAAIELPVTFADLDSPETVECQGTTWRVGERVSYLGRAGVVMSPTDPAYEAEYGHPVRTTTFVPVRFDSGSPTIDGVQPTNLQRTSTATATIEETNMPAGRVTFTPEQEEKLREVVGRIGREYGACAVAASALQELGVSQPQQTQVATVTIELRIPLANSSGQVQLPNAGAAPADYLSKTIGSRQLNDIADRMLADGGRGARSYRRQGDATATITNIA